MATKNTIVQKGNGHFKEYLVASGVTLKPGMACQLNSSGALALGVSGADGERGLVMIAVEDWNLGKTVNDAYTAGETAKVYCPLPGDEVLVLVTDAADAVVIGDKLICDVSHGGFIETTGTVESEPFIALEALGTLSVDTLCLAVATGN